MDQVKSEKKNLQELIKDGYFYNIPRYQRLYVWGDEQIKTMFNDVLIACESGKPLYFLGAVITVKSQYHDNCYDLVDGQQRFTTLWLMANELQGELLSFTKIGADLRLKFAIRKEVYNYFEALKTNRNNPGLENAGNELYKVSRALKAIRSLISEKLQNEEEKHKFIHFLLTKLYIVVTEVLQSTNLNKLFETLNNRGIQLNQYDILKNRLLSKINSNQQERIRYGKLWNACSDMNNYIERNINMEIGANMAYFMRNHDQFLYKEDVFQMLIERGRVKNKMHHLGAILTSTEDIEEDEFRASQYYHPNTNDDEFDIVRSILTFPQLLLHTLRIYQFRNKYSDIKRINEKELLSIFESVLLNDETIDEKSSKSFIDTLWEVRQAFDKYVIKWVKEDGDNQEETHVIKNIDIRNQRKGGQTYYARRMKNDKYDGLALLQSMLYHSQENITQYWLTPYLYRMLECPSFQTAYQELKRLDNVLFTSGLIEDTSLAERTWSCMDEYPEVAFDLKFLNRDLGTGFPHYWFYKLEFVLWHERSAVGKDEAWKNYKLNSRNSIEHIGPQRPRDERDKVCVEQLDSFGNLVLVTRSINSEYGDLSYKEKRAKFANKREKGSYDSLKSDLIYCNGEWNDGAAAAHREEMIKTISKYLEKTTINE